MGILGRLGRLIRAFAGAPAVRRAPAGTAPSLFPEQARAIMFPDYGIRQELETLHAAFDPLNLLLSLPVDLHVQKERDLITKGEFEAAKRIVRDKIFLMDAVQRLGYIFAATAGLHELRHLHDCFGTTSGFVRLQQVLRDGIEFNKLWDRLKSEGRITVPLAVWGRGADAPEALRTYLAERRRRIEHVHLLDGSMRGPQIQPGPDAVEAVMMYALKGLQTSVPAVVLNFKRESGEVFQKIVPLGLRVLMEGTAFATQMIAASEVFGGSYFEQMKAAVRQVPKDDEDRIHYMAVDLYLSKRLEKKFYTRFQLALSDLAMMAEDPAHLPEGHPGWRLSRATVIARGLGSVHEREGVDLAGYMDRIAREAGWKRVSEVAEAAVSESKAVMRKLESSPEAETLWPSILRATYRLHLLFMTIRVKVPDVLADPEVYLRMLDELPPPPAFESGTGKEFAGIIEEDGRAFLMWFMLEHIQRQLLFSTRLPCPEDHPHSCPGDPLTSKGWTPVDRCPFSMFVAQMGLPGLVVERVRAEGRG